MINRLNYFSSDVHHLHNKRLNDWLINYLTPFKEKTIIEFGCRSGLYLDYFYKNGFKNVIGLESDPLENNYEFSILNKNITQTFDLETKGIVISFLVGEHIEKELQDVYLDNLDRHCEDLLIIAWGTRREGDGNYVYNHINELDNNEIIPEITKRGFDFLEEDTNNLRSYIDFSCHWLTNSLMIFKRK